MKASIVTAMLVLACALAFGPNALPQDAPKEHSMTGCLAKGTDAGTYSLTNEKGVQTAVIAQSKANLAPHVGHKVEITGTAVPGTKTHTMNVTAVKHIAATCP